MPPKRFKTSNAPTKAPSAPAVVDEKYEKELAWCVAQLELGLTRKNVSKEQEQESRKVIDKLKSKSLSKVEKRQLMVQE